MTVMLDAFRDFSQMQRLATRLIRVYGLIERIVSSSSKQGADKTGNL